MQMSLFENNAEKLNLYKAVDDIKNRFGSKTVVKAVTSHLTESVNRNTTRHNKKKSS
jgi:DNA polymerase-4